MRAMLLGHAPREVVELRSDFTVVIDRPVEEVFAFVTDMTRTPEWRTTVQRAEALRLQGGSAIGARFRAVTRVAGRRWNWVLEVTTWDPPGRFAYAVVEGSVPMEVEYRCEPEGERCRFTMVASADEFDGVFGRVVVPAIAWGMRREVRSHVGNLKKILES
jgi:ligand-binding SRPBCC domain-containing protein